nr:mediator of RNA polymerase II transcription subunit 26 isoform X2 [Drosophila bipectinata]
MNQHQIQQLTSHLSQALDQNYDVINMDAVLSVICALEGTKITKEQLEATRLAKYINQLRRRTTNEHLARRAKSLLKKWREMVGIQQTVDSQQQTSQQTESLDFLKSAPPIPHFPEINSHLPISSSMQPQEIFSDINVNIDQSETQSLSMHSQAHSTLSSPYNNIIDLDRRENNSTISAHNYHNRLSHNIVGGAVNAPQRQLMKQSLNSFSSMSDVCNKKFNEVSVVIDIVSDSDENDNDSTKIVRSDISEPSSLVIPSSPSLRLKKNRKDKKNEPTLHRPNTKIGEKNTDGILHPPDSEVFSLSNSSMSSILSGDATMGNNSNKKRTNSSELTFSGRFNSINQQEDLNQNNFCIFSAKNNVSSHLNEIHKPLFEDYNANDSSASCSRFFSIVNTQNSEKLNDFYKHKQSIASQIHLPVEALCPVSNTTELLNDTTESRSQKKRGRKKGSRGVDAVISKESSSLCQQIFSGSSAVKKVKTTKELFNEIQSRKLSTTAHSSTFRNLTKCARIKRRTSSCSASINSPNLIENYSSNVTLLDVDNFSKKVRETVNTDSDTSDHFSSKSQEVKECTSLDSNSCSRQTSSFVNYSRSFTTESLNDITTQLMHLINSFGSPISVHEIEESYQAQLVPCSCIIFENDINLLRESKPFTSDYQGNKANPGIKCKGKFDHNTKQEKISTSHEQSTEKEEILKKPQKSIFDLDFEDEDDSLKSLVNAFPKPVANKATEKISKPHIFTNKFLLSLSNTNIDAQLDSCSQENVDELPKVIQSVFTINEDPDCLAKKRFYVQTNKVSSFHINALHNYYIPNINGNWDSIDESISFKSINDFLNTLYSYNVTNGSDVVPKYGFLQYDHIRKDLSSLKFFKPTQVKSFQKDFSPFLGVAKCLPTCRKYKRKTLDSHNESADQTFKNKLNRDCPLQIDTEIPISDMITYNNSLENMKYKESYFNPALVDHFDSSYISAISNNLLTFANKKEIRDGHAVDLKTQDNANPICKNSCKSPTLKNVSNIGKKKAQIRRHEKNRKRRGPGGGQKQDSEENTYLMRKIKRIKISLNDTITDRRGENNSSENDDTVNHIEVDGQHGKNEYEIVHRTSNDGGVSSNHIVLTIKKTPKNLFETEILKESSSTPNLNFSTLSNSLILSKESLPIRHRNRHLDRQTIRKSFSRKSNTVDLDLKHWFRFKDKVKNTVKKKQRLHKKLFFEDELLTENFRGQKHRIINYSSSSSSFDDSDFEYIAVKKKGDAKKIAKSNIKEIDRSVQSVLPVKLVEDKDVLSLGSDEEKDINLIHSTSKIIKNNVHEYEILRNNGMLLSFNSIFAKKHSLINNLNSVGGNLPKEEKGSLDILQTELNNVCNINEDVELSCLKNSIHVNNSKIELIGQKSSSIGALLNNQKCHDDDECFEAVESPSIEHRIGIRLSKNNLDNVVQSTSTIQKFKEWHQVLQLKSYNDEPLIVMPYVVLE